MGHDIKTSGQWPVVSGGQWSVVSGQSADLKVSATEVEECGREIVPSLRDLFDLQNPPGSAVPHFHKPLLSGLRLLVTRIFYALTTDH
jgi:hypothetical protein